MNFDIKDVLELSDGKQYVITSKAEYKGDEYLYIAEISDKNNIKFGHITRDGDAVNLVIVKDNALIKELLPLFTDSLNNFINE